MATENEHGASLADRAANIAGNLLDELRIKQGERERIRELTPMIPDDPEDAVLEEAPAGAYELEPDLPPHPAELQKPVRLAKIRPGNVLDKAAEREHQQAQRELLWRRAFAREEATLEELHPYRIRVAWRFAREISRLRGIVSDDESLLEALSKDDFGGRDPWTEETGFTPTNRGGTASLTKRVLQLLTHDPDLDTRNDKGLGLLPPRAPDDLVDYDPYMDSKLLRFIAACELMRGYLAIDQGSKNDPDQGRYGTVGLLNPAYCRLLWPSRTQIIAWEELLIEETTQSYIEDGYQHTRHHLRDEHGLTKHEVTALIKIARTHTRVRTDGDIEEERSLHILRLENLARRAKEALDLRTELAAMKQIAQVVGLGRTDPEDTLKDFMSVIDSVSKDDDPPLLEGKAPRMLTSDPTFTTPNI